MTPATWLVALLVTVSCLYTATAGAYYFHSRPGMAVAFVGYVVANIGLIWDALQK